MLEETATVVKAINQDLWVRTDRQTICNGCAANKGCGISLIDKVFKNKPALLQVRNDVFARVGDKVVVGIEENAFLRASLLVYFLPLVFMMGFALFGHFVYSPVTSVNTMFADNFTDNFTDNN
jgi:sigma-E factor negative regulatory protein RseC